MQRRSWSGGRWEFRGATGSGGPARSSAGTALAVVARVLPLCLAACVATSEGDRFLAEGHPEAAIVAYARHGGTGADDHRRFGLAFYRAGLLAAAEREFQRARTLRPNDPSAALFLAEIAADRGDSAAARAHYRDFGDLRPEAAPWVVRHLDGTFAAEDPALRAALQAREEHAILHPERARGRGLLETVAGRVAGSSPGRAEGDQEDPQVTDVGSWTLGAAGLPEFPPPPGGAR